MLKYKPTMIYEPGLKYNMLQSITAMMELENFSTEEIRFIDYKESGYLFGSRTAAVEHKSKIQLSVTPIQLFEYSHNLISSMTPNPSHDTNLSISKKPQIIANSKSGYSLDVHVTVDKSTHINYSVEGYQPPRKQLSKTIDHQSLANATTADQLSEKQPILVDKRHHSSHSSLKPKNPVPKNQMRLQPKNKENYRSSSTSSSKKHPSIEKREQQRNLDPRISKTSPSVSKVEPKGIQMRQQDSENKENCCSSSSSSSKERPSTEKRDHQRNLDTKIDKKSVFMIQPAVKGIHNQTKLELKLEAARRLAERREHQRDIYLNIFKRWSSASSTQLAADKEEYTKKHKIHK